MFPVLSRTRREMLGSSESSEGNMESSSMSEQQQRQSSDEEFSSRDVAVQNESLLPEILVPRSEYDDLDDLIEDFDELGTDAIEADAETETADETDEEIEGACGGQNLARRSRILPRKTGLHWRATRLQRGRSRGSGTPLSKSQLQNAPGEKVAGRAGHRTSNVARRGRTLKSQRCTCDVCGKQYANFSSLTVHKRRHTGERPFRCELCPMSFVQSCALTKHMRKHTGERPFACPRCGVTFSQKHGLTRHNRHHCHIR
ncbi:hypothetical protein R5R35_004447 [Gryllus longicercus]|uniref:C2H2-type domain-containing protein n=1 Tax=Gryllus longicercus TaxID=2509291 RepID=A0AAN9VE69_9ORTH